MTKLLFLSDTYLFEGDGTILERGKNDFGDYIILDQTIFYPQGGGQPSDIGTISDESRIFEVTMVRLDEHGTAYHYGKYRDGTLNTGQTVQLRIDRDRRILNARNHSAGHLIDIAIKNIGLDSLEATKGYHFADGPYVEYSGNLSEGSESIIPRLQAEIERLAEKDLPIIVNYDSSRVSPIGKTPRHVSYAGYEGCGCGGTHVKSSGEIGKILIRKIKIKDKSLRISYSLSDYS